MISLKTLSAVAILSAVVATPVFAQPNHMSVTTTEIFADRMIG